MATIIKGKNPRKPYTVRYQDRGKQREASFATRKEALDFKSKFEHDSRANIFIDPRQGRLQFADYAARWIDGLERADKTKAQYRSALRKHIEPSALGNMTVAQVAEAREAVQSFLASVESPSARRIALVVILGAVREAVHAGRISNHRLDGIAISREAVQPAVITPVTNDQLRKIAAWLKRDGLVVWLMRGCGIRPAEALAVRLDSFRDNGRTLRVSGQIASGKVAPLKHRKPGEYRDVPVPAWLWEMVQAHVNEYGTDDGFLFGSNGARSEYRSFVERFATGAKRAGLAGMIPYNLRHLYASTLLSNGVPITDVSAWLGHRDFNVTYQTYCHLLPDSWSRGRDALESILEAAA